MRLTVAANYDSDVVPQLQSYPVAEVYGKFPVDFVGGGRPSYMGTPLSAADLRAYVAILQRHGIAFNYLLNSSCLGNREWTRRFQRRISSLLDRLQQWGITWLTVSTPFLLELIKTRFPSFRVKVGIYAQVDTLKRAKFWEDLGADAINLESFSINRDLPRLATIRKAVRCDLQLIANHPCLPNCALQPYHQNGIAHGSDGSRNLFIDYCFLRCSRMRLADPSLFIKSAWIRPEDLHVYEAMGYETFKLLERGMPSEDLLKRVRAYSDRRFDGNLAEILLPYGFKKPVRKQRFWLLRHFLKPWQVSIRRGRKILDLTRSQGMLHALEEIPVRIDSAAIPANFLEGFRGRDCAMLDCRECRYCERIAEKAVYIHPGYREESLGKYNDVEQAMAGGVLWGFGQ
jgi:collagenase-like PrtC family protease